MKFISTRGSSPDVWVSEAIINGLAPDGGLYIPQVLPHLDMKHAPSYKDYPQLAHFVLSPFFEGDVLEDELLDICKEAFNFPIPLHFHNKNEAVLELFHGPTAAFKDFGARFLAITMERLLKKSDKKLTILVATSGDTGGAVAAAFHKRENICVKVLFPKGRVSARQEKQLTCYKDNITSFAVDGSFDDCQKVVKEAFMDKELSSKEGLTSANSINLGRLLPQMVYAFSSSLEMKDKCHEDATVIIPSGNVGNSCASLYAKEMGAPIKSIILSVNSNTTIVDYINSGFYEGRASISTLANAMDVGDPSNMERIFYLYPTHESFMRNLSAVSVSDDEIIESISDVYKNHHYIVCPHTATGEKVRKDLSLIEPTIVYATAHAAKFETIVEPIINQIVEIPSSLSALLEKEQHYTSIKPDYHLLF